MLSRSEAAGITVAVAAHVLLFGFLSLQYLYPPPPLKLNTDPIEVSISDDVGLRSEAPEISTEAPAAKLSAVEAPIEEEVAPETPPVPDPKPKPDPKPQPKPEPAPDAKPAKPTQPSKTTTTAKPTKQPTKPVVAGGRLDGIVDGLTEQPTKGTSTKPPAASIGPEVKSSLVGAIRRMLKPNWKSPTGADVDQLRTFVQVKLDKSGKLLEVKVVKQEGKTELNRPQWELHAERAIAAVKKTNFDTAILKDEYYSVWGNFVTVFDKRL
jgi:outer membrane biosynthesis protein TonB